MAENKGAIANVNLDSLLDSTLDNLADLPEFKAFPPGAHKCTIKWEAKQIGEHPAVELKITALETLELADAAKDQPLVAGTETTVAYMMDNEFGQGKFKEVMAALSLHYGEGKTNRQYMAESEGAEVILVTDARQNKDKTQTYTDVKNVLFQ